MLELRKTDFMFEAGILSCLQYFLQNYLERGFKCCRKRRRRYRIHIPIRVRNRKYLHKTAEIRNYYFKSFKVHTAALINDERQIRNGKSQVHFYDSANA